VTRQCEANDKSHVVSPPAVHVRERETMSLLKKHELELELGEDAEDVPLHDVLASFFDVLTWPWEAEGSGAVYTHMVVGSAKAKRRRAETLAKEDSADTDDQNKGAKAAKRARVPQLVGLDLPRRVSPDEIEAARGTECVIETLLEGKTPHRAWQHQYAMVLANFRPLCHAVVRDASRVGPPASDLGPADKAHVTQDWLVQRLVTRGEKVPRHMLSAQKRIKDVFSMNLAFFTEAWCAASTAFIPYGLALDLDSPQSSVMHKVPMGFSLCRASPTEKGWFEIILICTGGLVKRWEALTNRKGVGKRLVDEAMQVARQRGLRGVFLKAVLGAEAWYVNVCGFTYDREGRVHDPVVGEETKQRIMVDDNYYTKEEIDAYNALCTELHVAEKTGVRAVAPAAPPPPRSAPAPRGRRRAAAAPPPPPPRPGLLVKLWKPVGAGAGGGGA
jgi:hypothetical protein